MSPDYINFSPDPYPDIFINPSSEFPIMKLVANKGGHGVTYYLRVPKDIIDAFGISKDDEFVLNATVDKDGQLVLCYKRIRNA